MPEKRIFSGYSKNYPLTAAPKRIISLVPSITELIFDLGLGSKLIGRTDWCIEPKGQIEQITSLGGTKNPRIKDIVELKPDLVIVNKEENRRIDVERIEAKGLATWLTSPTTVDEALELMQQMNNLLDDGAPNPTNQKRIQALEAKVREKRETTPNKLTAACFIWRDPWMAVAGNTYINDVMELLGLENVFASIGEERYPRVTAEQVQALNPEVLLLPDEPYVFSEQDRQELCQWEISAAKNSKVYLVEGSLLSWYGFRVERALEELRF